MAPVTRSTERRSLNAKLRGFRGHASSSLPLCPFLSGFLSIAIYINCYNADFLTWLMIIFSRISNVRHTPRTLDTLTVLVSRHRLTILCVLARAPNGLIGGMFVVWGWTKDDTWIIATRGRVFIDTSHSVSSRPRVRWLDLSWLISITVRSVFSLNSYNLVFPSLVVTRYIFTALKIILTF
jgi:hypothetical protein